MAVSAGYGDDVWRQPMEIPAPEGCYLLYTSPDLSARLKPVEFADLVPGKVRISYTTLKRPPADGGGEGKAVSHLVYNCRRHVYWFQDRETSTSSLLSHAQQGSECPTTHDINAMSRSPTTLHLAIGFSNGELLVRELFSKAENWLNLRGIVEKSAVTVVKWVPGSETSFVAGHANGHVYMYDTERSDTAEIKGPSGQPRFAVCHAKQGDSNPATQWHLPSEGAVYDLAFSPDTRHLAVVTKDGMLQVLDFKEENEVFSASSYFGALYCVSWSPDGLYLLTGGQDDLVTIWSFEERDIVARGQGHSSWVYGVAFDKYTSDKATYRFGSVGHDARLLLWDFSVNTLRMPRSPSKKGRAALSPQVRKKKKKKDKKAEKPAGVVVEARPRSEVPVFDPIVSARVHQEPLTALYFSDDAILTACQSGQIKVWRRPEVVVQTAV